MKEAAKNAAGKYELTLSAENIAADGPDASAILAGSTRSMTIGRKLTDSDFPIASEPSDNPWGLDGIIGE